MVNRNINYTNVCYFRCQFCAFSKGKMSENLRGRPYDLPLEEIVRRVREAWERGATEVCLQGGIHPDYTGETYLSICRAIKAAEPAIHVHAFSPLEIWQGAATLGRTVPDFLAELQEAGLGSLPGTAAEILDDEVRAVICPDKIATDQWLSVMEAAHGLGLRSTATIMFGHVDSPRHWARHLLRVRALQERTGGFTEFVPLPFVAMEAPLYLKGRARRGPTWREAVLMHAVARLALNPVIANIQTSWVKMGPEGAAACLKAGANDIGGTLMNESITRAAGASHGQEFAPEAIEALVEGLGRTPVQRTTLYQPAPTARRAAAQGAAPLAPVVNAPARRYERRACARRLSPIIPPRATWSARGSMPPPSLGRASRGGGAQGGGAATMAGFTITSTNHTSFTVSSLDRAIGLFRDALGFELLNRSPRDPKFIEQVVGVEGADIEVAYLQAPGHRLELIEYRGPADRGRVESRPCDAGFAHIAFDVDDIHEAIAAVRDAGSEPLGAPITVNAGPNKGGLVVYTRDPDGITVEFIQRPKA